MLQDPTAKMQFQDPRSSGRGVEDPAELANKSLSRTMNNNSLLGDEDSYQMAQVIPPKNIHGPQAAQHGRRDSQSTSAFEKYN